MKLFRIFAFLLLTVSLHSQDLLPRHAEAQIKTSSCQTFLHFKLNGIVQVGDIGHMEIRFPMSCNASGLVCRPLPIATRSLLGNLWVFDLSWGHGYGKNMPNIAWSPDALVVQSGSFCQWDP